MRKSLVFAALAAIAFVTTARADVLKTLLPDCSGQKLCPVYSIVLTPPDGWVLDEAATAERHVQILVPKGETVDSAAAIIYVQVFYLRTPQTPADFAKNSNARWLAASPSSTIAPAGEITRTNGKPSFLGFAYDNPGNAEQAHELGAFAPDSDNDGNAFMLDAVLTGEKPAVMLAKEAYLAWLKGL